jgi:hypothetical protein
MEFSEEIFGNAGNVEIRVDDVLSRKGISHEGDLSSFHFNQRISR